MSLARLLLLFAVALIVGCGGSEKFETIRVTPPSSPTDQARTVLDGVAQTGEVGSGVDELRQLFEQIKQSDPAKGDALLNDLSALESTKDPSAAKAKAQEMLGKL